jgi:hypothetical protein
VEHAPLTRKQPRCRPLRQEADQHEEREARIEEIIERAKQSLAKASQTIAEARRLSSGIARKPPR